MSPAQRRIFDIVRPHLSRLHETAVRRLGDVPEAPLGVEFVAIFNSPSGEIFVRVRKLRGVYQFRMDGEGTLLTSRKGLHPPKWRTLHG